MTRIVASAPGKLVLLGEYAVLEGAPALVLAVNRRARVTLATHPSDTWAINSPTLGMDARLHVAADGAGWAGDAAPELAWVAMVVGQLPFAPHLPACRVELESDAFHLGHTGAPAKLGLGSSAALTVALLGALHALARQPPPALADCVRIHRSIQHGRGSGIDVAASHAGGLSRYQLDAAHRPRHEAMAFPDGLHWRCVYSGKPASTGEMLATIAAWRAREPERYAHHVNELATISSRGVDAVAAHDAAAFLSGCKAYALALARFGEASGLDIASRAHRELGQLAAACGCVYKSCGAGGGDVGITVAVDDVRLRDFAARATQAGFPVIEMEADERGLQVDVND